MRTAGKANAGYFRSPEKVIEAIAPYINVGSYRKLRFLDPCCGKGIALELLVKTIKKRAEGDLQPHQMPDLTTYGIETNQTRVRRAQRRLGHVVNASFFEAVITNGSFSCMLLNPPYDFDKEAVKPNGSSQRLEVTFLIKGTHKLTPDGTAIIIVSQHILKEMASFLASWYTDFLCLRFPDDKWDPREEEQKEQDKRDGSKEAPLVSMYEQFKQVVLICKKQAFQQPVQALVLDQLIAWSEMGADLEALPLRKEDIPLPRLLHYSLYTPRFDVNTFLSKAFDTDGFAQKLSIAKGKSRPSAGVWASEQYQALHWPTDEQRKVSIGYTLGPIKQAHRALLAVAGIVNGCTLTSEDGTRQLTVKGYTRKVVKTKVVEDEEAVTKTQKDTYQSNLWGIDPANGKLYCIDASGGSEPNMPFRLAYERMSLKDFLRDFGKSLTEAIVRTNPSLYIDESQVPWAQEAFDHLKRQPLGKKLGKQRDFILSQVNYLVYSHGIRSGEVAMMATGKTFMSLAIAYLSDLWCSGLTHLFPKSKHSAKRTRRRLSRPPHFSPVMVLVPTTLTRKWKREAEQTIPDVKAVVIQRIDTMKASQELHEFDPTFPVGNKLSAIGCADRVMAHIQAELDAWERDCEQACQQKTPLPKKPFHLVIVNLETAKLGMEWSARYGLRPVRTAGADGKVTLAQDQASPDEANIPYVYPYCPSCGTIIRNEARVSRKMREDRNYKNKMLQREKRREQVGSLNPTEDEDGTQELGVFASEKEIQGSSKSRYKWFCTECGEALWSNHTTQNHWQSFSPFSLFDEGYLPNIAPLPSNLSELSSCITSTVDRRYPVADYISKKYPHKFNLLIADEVHQGNEGTAISFARESLIQSCGHMLGLTGTLCDGKSSSLFPLMRMINPEVMARFGYHGTKEWVRAYGVMSRTQKNYKDKEVFNSGTGAVTKRQSSEGKVVENEAPGFSPYGLRHVLNCCSFLELKDVAPHLPHLGEYVRIIGMGSPLGEAYDKFESVITQEMRVQMARGNKSVLSPWFNALLCYPNMPYRGWIAQIKSTGEFLGEAPELPEDIVYPKEQELIRLVEEQKAKNRRVLVYVEHTGDLDIMPRLKHILQKQVKTDSPLRVIVMHSDKPKPIDREEWIGSQVQAGCDVLICHPKTVQVGLDLIAFPTIVFWEIPTSTSVLRQASRRHHRPGQNLPCEVHYMAYPSIEMRMLYLMADKTRASMMVEGQIGESGLLSLRNDDDEDPESYRLALARQVMDALDSGEAKKSIAQMAAELEAVFEETTQIEQEQQKLLVDMTVATLANEYESGEINEVEVQEWLPPVVLEPVTSHTLPASTPDQEPLTVMVVPMSSADMWDVLYQQDMAARAKKKQRSKKKSASPSSGPTLFSLPEGKLPEVSQKGEKSLSYTTASVEPLPNDLTTSSLW